MNKKITNILDAKALERFQRVYAPEIVLSEQQANVILGYLKKHAYAIGAVSGHLYIKDLCDRDGGQWKSIKLTAVIDSVLAWNYMLIEDITKVWGNEKKMNKEIEKYYLELRNDGRLLDKISVSSGCSLILFPKEIRLPCLNT